MSLGDFRCRLPSSSGTLLGSTPSRASLFHLSLGGPTTSLGAIYAMYKAQSSKAYTQNTKHKSIYLIMTDESLFSPIPFPFCVYLYGCLSQNCLSLVDFRLMGFIGPLFQILINLALISLIFVSSFFRYFLKQFWILDANHKVKRELPRHFHIIATFVSCQSAYPCHWASIFCP